MAETRMNLLKTNDVPKKGRAIIIAISPSGLSNKDTKKKITRARAEMQSPKIPNTTAGNRNGDLFYQKETNEIFCVHMKPFSTKATCTHLMNAIEK